MNYLSNEGGSIQFMFHFENEKTEKTLLRISHKFYEEDYVDTQ